MGAACLRDESALYQLCTDDLLLRLLMTRQTVPSANCCANGAPTETSSASKEDEVVASFSEESVQILTYNFGRMFFVLTRKGSSP